jgi:serine/threonine protein kinase
MLTQREHINFNNLPLPPDHYRILHAMLPLCKTNVFLEKNHTYKGIEFIDSFGQPHKVDVTLSHEMWHLISDRNEDRYVIKSETQIGEGNYGKVSNVLYTIEPLNTIDPLIGSVKLKNYNERVIKIQMHNNKFPISHAIDEVQSMRQAGHLGAKNLVTTPMINQLQTSASVMAKVGTKSLNSLINSTYDPLELYEETINTIQAHIEQNINNHIIHKDIKPDNVRRDPQTHSAYFIDYGFSTSMDIPNSREFGTPLYSAPELHCPVKHSTKLDTFSLGVTLIEMWKGSVSEDHGWKIFNNNYFSPTDKYHIGNLFKGISDDSLPFYYKKKIQNILDDMLKYDLNHRISTEQALDRFKEAYLEFITRSNHDQKNNVHFAYNLAKEDKQLESKIDIKKFKELLLSRWNNFSDLQRDVYLKALGIKEIRNITTKDILMNVIDSLNNSYEEHMDYLSQKLRQLEKVKTSNIVLNSEYNEIEKILTKQKQKKSTLIDVINFEQKYQPRMNSIQESLLGLISAPAGTTSNITSASTPIASDRVDAITICKKITAHINKLKFGWNPLKSSAEAKITALENLKIALLKHNRGEKLEDVISKWLSEEAFQEEKIEKKVSTWTVISRHRFIFLPETRHKLTNTRIFINDLTNDFGDKILKRNG